jgi:hypothetical protein
METRVDVRVNVGFDGCGAGRAPGLRVGDEAGWDNVMFLLVSMERE